MQPLKTLPPSRILVVNNHEGSAKELATQLRKAGHEVEVANDGPGALEVEPTFRPDIAIIDLGLTGMDACTVARSLRAQTKRGMLLVCDAIVATDWSSRQEDHERALQAGCFDDSVGRPHGMPILPRLRIKLAERSVEDWFSFEYWAQPKEDLVLRMLEAAAGQFEPVELAPLIPDESLREIRKLAESPTDLADYMAGLKNTLIWDERREEVSKGAARWFRFFNP